MKSPLDILALLFLTSAVLTGCMIKPTKKPDLSGNFGTEQAGWRFLGPDGMPNVVVHTGTHGVGQANRLVFDPQYDGENNRTLYACSSFGGLWRSDDDGLSWYNLHTDFLPTTSVADVCVHPTNREMIFIATGYADGGIDDTRGPSWSQINPLPTAGIFRSKNGGITWEDISDGFIQDFDFSGIPRKMIINPLNPDQVLIATTQGIYQTLNATSQRVQWRRIFTGEQENTEDFRSVLFKPDDPSVIYAAGKDIYRSSNQGKKWKRITAAQYGLDLRAMADTFAVDRINLAVTPAAPERLYAYIMGDRLVRDKRFKGAIIAVMDGEKWKIADIRWSAGNTYFAVQWIALAVSPVDPDVVYYGNSKVIGTDQLWKQPFGLRSPYSGNGFHADVHDLVFQPNVARPLLFCANHGGISVKNLAEPGITGWQYRNQGYGAATIWSFDDTPRNPHFAAIATQDNGTLIRYDTLGYQWHFIGGGDGYTARIDQRFPSQVYFSHDDHALFHFDLHTFRVTNLTHLLPLDPRNNRDMAITVKTFPLIHHPITGKPWFGFSEIFSMEIPPLTPEVRRDEVWKRQSNLYQSEPEAWKRQIIDIAICYDYPDHIYLVTAGQQNPPRVGWQLPSGLYRSQPEGTGDNPDQSHHFIPLSYPGQNFDDDTLAIITGICVHPSDPDRIWITYTGIPRQFRIWESRDGGKNWINADPYGVFATNPVNAIALARTKPLRIYLGTDRGLYFSAIDKTDWKHVSDFPNVRITEIKIHEALNLIRVATFGRGLWEGPLN